MNSRFSGSSGFGSWFGKRPVGLEEAGHGVDRQPVKDGGSITPAIPFAASITTRSGLIASDVDERQDPVGEAGRHVALARPVPGLSRTSSKWASARSRIVEQARVAADGQRAAADDLHARVLLRVVRGGDHDPAVEVEVADGEIEHLRADEPDVDDVGAASAAPSITASAIDGEESRMSRPTAIALRLELLDVGAADRVGALLVELVRVDAAYVVGLEDLGIEHPVDANAGLPAREGRPVVLGPPFGDDTMTYCVCAADVSAVAPRSAEAFFHSCSMSPWSPATEMEEESGHRASRWVASTEMSVDELGRRAVRVIHRHRVAERTGGALPLTWR